MSRSCLVLSLGVVLSACGGDQAPAGAARDTRAPAAAKEAESRRWDFDDNAEGAGAPAGWTLGETQSGGTPAVWSVVAASDAPTPTQVFGVTASANTGQTYNVAAAPKLWAADVSLSVSVQAVAGAEDQGGGPLWRFLDADNYYVCRINPLEDNFRVYKVVDGVRTELASADVATEPGRWYAIRANMQGQKITCVLDRVKLLEVEDDALPRPGRVGLWTKADAETLFDSLSAMKL